MNRRRFLKNLFNIALPASIAGTFSNTIAQPGLDIHRRDADYVIVNGWILKNNEINKQLLGIHDI